MNYSRVSQVNPDIRETYTIQKYNLDKLSGEIFVILSHADAVADGSIVVTQEQFNVINVRENIIDPDWSSSSNPAKPDGFDQLDPSTWEDLAFDEIPLVTDPAKLFATICHKEITNGKAIEQALFEILVMSESLPSADEGWEIK